MVVQVRLNALDRVELARIQIRIRNLNLKFRFERAQHVRERKRIQQPGIEERILTGRFHFRLRHPLQNADYPGSPVHRYCSLAFTKLPYCVKKSRNIESASIL